MSDPLPKPVQQPQNTQNNPSPQQSPVSVQANGQEQKRQAQNDPTPTNGHPSIPAAALPLNGTTLQRSSQQQNESPSDDHKNNSPSPNNEPHNSSNEESPSEGEEDKSDNNLDENKSDNDNDEEDEDQSNVKSDQRDEDEERSGEDMKKEEPSGKKCFNKLCNSKKIYKKLRSKVEHAKYRFLCRPCYENYCNNDFCEFCEQIYSSTGNADDDDQWIGCDECNRWNHIECQKKYRNKNIHETNEQDAPYLCLTCSYKPNQKSYNQKKASKNPKDYTAPVDQPKSLLKQKLQISKDQRVQVFNRKIQNLPSLEYFLQNYNFRLWINENLIKDDLQTLREASKRSNEDGKKGNKKVKVD